jgi:hypothetical protein
MHRPGRLSAVAAACVATLAGADFVHHSTGDYRPTDVQGHVVYISPEAAADAALLQPALARLDSDLIAIHTLLPLKAVAALLKVPFWVEHDNPETPGMTFHPSREWLQAHGYNIAKAECIEIGNLRNFVEWHREQPFMVLHELAHAFHHRVLGVQNATIRAAFDAAVTSRRYESVAYVMGGTKRAYALNNPAEYFAELSEAYWGKNDFYPFVRKELQGFDPLGFQMVENLWSAQ